MTITSSDIALFTNGILKGSANIPVNEIVTDSRQLSYSAGQLFIAIRGKNHDGHIFVENLYKSGVRVFIVEELPASPEKYKDAAFILTKNSVQALQMLAAWKRKTFSYPVIGVTGSAGKTVVKEWLADILGITTPVIRSPKSYNSQIGVPLSVWKLDEKYRLGIFEAGISLPGEMEKLTRVIDPEIGVITNIGDAHQENFKDIREKASEKLKLFSNASKIIYCSDYKLIDELIRGDKQFNDKLLIDWSFINAGAAVYVEKSELPSGLTGLKVSFKGKKYSFEIPFIDRASVENAVTVTAVCLALGTDSGTIAKGLAGLVSVAMRMEMKNGINKCQLIEDYYNSDPGSLGMALDYIKSQSGRRSTLILSDFVQSGRDEKELYSEVAELLVKTGIDNFIGVGEALIRNRALFGKNSNFYRSTDDFAKSFNSADYRNEIILLKGARFFEFEKIAKLLEQQIHQTVLEVNLDAISHNINEFRRYLNPGTRIMAMVKAFAYGAGPAEIAALLEFHRVSYLGVAYADEGVELRNAGVTIPVMVMNPDPNAAEVMIKYNLEPEIFSFDSFDKFNSVASKHGLINYPVHIKIDTGMHRLGFLPQDIDSLTERIIKTESLKITSVFSHLAASEDPSLDDFTHRQAKIFLEVSDSIEKATGYPFIRHILNSSGISRHPQYQFEMVRPGIGIYGVGHFEGLNLRPAGRFKTRISQIKKVPAGDSVSYGCHGVSDNERTIAIIPVGYADGFSRRLGNDKGTLYINGKFAHVTGNVCMDMCMADISGIEAAEGDEVEIFGEHIPVEDLAEKCGTIPYEILTSIPGRVKRVFYRE